MADPVTIGLALGAITGGSILDVIGQRTGWGPLGSRREQVAGVPIGELKKMLAARRQAGLYEILMKDEQGRAALAQQLAGAGILDSGAAVAGLAEHARGTKSAVADLESGLMSAFVQGLSTAQFQTRPGILSTIGQVGAQAGGILLNTALLSGHGTQATTPDIGSAPAAVTPTSPLLRRSPPATTGSLFRKSGGGLGHAYDA